MKRPVIANPGISLMGMLRRNKLSVVALSLPIIGIAFLLIVQYEKGIVALQYKWEPRTWLGEDLRLLDGSRKPVIKNQPMDLIRYKIKANFITMDIDGGGAEIQFCDKYILLLAEKAIRSGVYYKADNNAKKYVSTADYRGVISRKKAAYPQLKSLNLYLECDLIEKTASIYIDGKFIEKINLGPETIRYAVRVSINSKGTILGKLEISDHTGKVLFNADYALPFFYKLISQILFSLGIFIFLALAFSVRSIFKGLLYFAIILLSIEAFLRIAEKYNQNFNIRYLQPKWRFEISTNFYGTYNDPEKITIRNYLNRRPETYPIAKPEHSQRIICIGSSPLMGISLPDPINQVFPALLEKKINPGGGRTNRVININFMATSSNSPEPNIYLKEVLWRLNPDLVIFYTTWELPKTENSPKYIGEEHALYNRAKKIMEDNSGWIKNDQLLYAALEFKKPIKEIVYLYRFLCQSYLFMGLESVRKRLFNSLYYIGRGPSADNPEPYFEETIRLCREKKIKLLLIPQFDFFAFQDDQTTKKEIARIINENPDIYYLDLEDAFRRNKDFALAYDHSHPNEYGHMIIAEEIFRKLTQEGLLNSN